LRVKYNINLIQWQARFSKGDDLSVKCNNEKSKVKAAVDSATGVTRDTAKRLAQRLGVDETQAIHLALHPSLVRAVQAAFRVAKE